MDPLKPILKSDIALPWKHYIEIMLQNVFVHELYKFTFTFTFMHLADAFIQSDLQLHSGYTFY